MITGKEDLLQSLIEAFLMEKGTREFYAQASAKVAGKEAQETYKYLSTWEEEHMAFIQFLYMSVQDERDIKGFAEFSRKTEAPVTEAGIPVKDLEARLEQYTFTDDKGALDLALEIEGKAYAQYRRLAESAPDKNAQVVFREMMEQEVKHIEYLKKMRQ